MKIRPILVSLLIAAAIGSSGLVLAASNALAKEQSTNRPEMGHGMKGSGMMQGDMMGMMNGCKAMMHSSMAPQLPPGNEKLQLQMQGEMMQKMGEILTKYADKISADKGSTQ
jgi:hypothetical protein